MRFNSIIAGFFFLLCFSACQKGESEDTGNTDEVDVSEMGIHEDSIFLDVDKGLVFYHEELFSGLAVRYYDNGNLSIAKDYVNGKKHGHYRKWFEDGLLSFESEYVDGFQQGRTATWWSNENLRSDSNYEKGVPDGKQYQYYTSGNKFKNMNLSNGKEEGLQQSWRENGKLYNNYEAKNGRIFGLKRASLCFQLDNEIVQYED